jgi:hypothetical protein
MAILSWSIFEQFCVLLNYRSFNYVRFFFGINSVNPKGRNPTLQVGSRSFSSSLIALLFGRQINYYVRKTVTFGPIQNQVIQSASQYLITFWLNYYFSSLLLRLTSFHQLNFSNEICLPICLISVITVCDEFKSVTLDLLPKDNKYMYLKRTWEKETTR